MDAQIPTATNLLRDELQEPSPSNDHLIETFAAMSPEQLAELFVTASFFRSVLQPLIDQDWLRQHRSDPAAYDLRPGQMKNELRTLSFLAFEIVNASSKQLKTYFNRMTHLLHVLVLFVQMEELERFRAFVAHAMTRMSTLACEQDSFPHNHFTEAMYRAFDQMDEIFGIRYDLDIGMIVESAQRERLYEGAGLGVQTSYSSILLALDRARVEQGARVMDLGSGYGRVGFVLGLLRPDISFTGVEYVEHRVLDSRAVASRAGLSSVDFITGDLSIVDIPFADVYYMYDPFSKTTYARVLKTLVDYGRRAPITIITKGRANSWVREALLGEGWSIDETCDSGTICLFTSTPASQSETAQTFVLSSRVISP